MFKPTRLVAVAVVLALSLHIFADGTVTVQNPVSSWKIMRVAFTPQGDSPTAFVLVGYYRADGSLDHSDEASFAGSEYSALLVAVNTPSGSDEANLTMPGGAADLRAIFNLRISRFMVAHNKISGGTAEPTQ